MKSLLFCLLLMLIPQLVFARLGESEAEIKARYGESKRTDQTKPGEESAHLYYKNDYRIRVGYYQGKAAIISYSRLDNNNLSEAEVATLLEANKGDSKWEISKVEAINAKIWDRIDGKAVAYNFQYFTPPYLAITTPEFQKHLAKAEEQNKNDKLKDF